VGLGHVTLMHGHKNTDSQTECIPSDLKFD
jgi:hypothetical protein